MPDTALISDDEATELLGEYDYASPERQGYIGTLLRQYQGQQVQIQKQQTDTHFEKLFTDADYFNSVADSPQVKAAASVNPFPDSTKYRGANQAFLAHKLGVDPSTLNGVTYEAQRDGYARANFGKEATVSDESFFNGVKGQMQQSIDTRKAIEEVPADIVASRFEDADNGVHRSVPELLTEWRKRFPDLKPGEGDEARMLQTAQAFAENTDAFMGQYGNAVKSVYDVLKFHTQAFDATTEEGKAAIAEVGSGKAEKDYQDLVSNLAQIPTDDRQKVYAYAALYAKKVAGPDGDWRTVFDNLQKSVLRSVEDPVIGLLNARADKEAEDDSKSTDPAVAEKGRQKLAAIQIGRELKNVSDSAIDPIKMVSQGWGKYPEQGAYALAGSAPYLALSAIPTAGPVLTMSAYAGTEYDRIRLEYPDVSLDAARGMSIVSGGAQALLDKLQVATIAGRLPATAKLLDELARPTVGTGTRIAVASGLNFAEQFGQETAQNLTPIVVDQVAKNLGADIPDKDWSKEFEDFKDTEAQTFFALLPLWLIGTGAISVRETAKGQKFASNVEAMTQAGFDPDAAREIAAEQDPDKRDALVQMAWRAMPDEKKKALIESANAAAKAATEAQESAQAPTIETVVEEDGTTSFVVKDHEGNEVSRTKDGEAAELAFDMADKNKAIQDLLKTSDRDEQQAGNSSDVEGEQAGLLFGDAGATEGSDGNSLLSARQSGSGDASMEAVGSRPRMEANSARRGFDALGVGRKVEGGFESPKIGFDDHGNLTLHIYRDYFSGSEAVAGQVGEESGKFTRFILGEELLHAAHLTSLRDEWNAQNRPGTFREFVTKDSLEIFDDIRDTINNAPAAERKALLEAARASYHVYGSNLTAGVTGPVALDTLLDDIAGKGDSVRFVGEFLRQAAQMRRTGSFSEEVHANLSDKASGPLDKLVQHLAAWVREAIAKLKAALPKVADGTFGKRAQDRLTKLEAIADIADRAINGSESSDGGKGTAGETSSLSGRALDPSVQIAAALAKLDKDPNRRREAVARARKKIQDLKAKKPVSQKLGGALREAAIAQAKEQHTNDVAGIQADEKAAIDAATTPQEKQKAKFGFVSKRQAADVRLQKRLDEITGESTRIADIRQSMNQLEAIRSILPLEVRAKIGGYQNLTTIKTDRGRASYLANRVEMVESALEKWLSGHYDDKFESLLKRARPAKNKAGAKIVGKVGSSVHEIFDVLREAKFWDAGRAETHALKLESDIATGHYTPEEEAHMQTEANLVRLVGDWAHADAERRASAYDNALKTLEKGYSETRMKKLAESQRRAGVRVQAESDTGTAGTLAERQQRLDRDNGTRGGLKDSFLNLSDFKQVMSYIFGEKSTVGSSFVDQQRNADNEKQDGMKAKLDEIAEFFKSVAGTAYKGEKLQYELGTKKNVTFKNPKYKGLSFTQLEAVDAVLMWNRAQGRMHMIGKLDDTGKPIGRWNYDQAFIDEIERQLSPEAVQWKDWLSKTYAAEHAQINPIYERRYNISLPNDPNYYPVSAKPLQMKGVEFDPLTGGVVAKGATTPSALKALSSHVAEPDFRDSAQKYIAHIKQMEHWKAFGDLAGEAMAILNNRDVMNAVQAKGGTEAAKVLGMWVDYFAQGGTIDASAQLSINKNLSEWMSNAAGVALVGKASVLAVQSTQLGAALAKMPVGAYLTRLSKLMSGQLGWADALNSEYIQRRLTEQPIVVQQLMEGLKAGKPSYLRHQVAKIGNLISGADALFTAGTYAMILDHQRGVAKDMGLTGADAEAYAHEQAESMTDDVAQPTRPGARSIYENVSTHPLSRLAWSFASETRQKLALAVWAAASKDKPIGERARALAVAWVIGGAVATLIRSAVRDSLDPKDDEWLDDRNWNPKRLLLASLTGPVSGFPVVGDAVTAGAYKMFGVYQPEGTILDVTNSVGAIKRLPDTVQGKQDAEHVLADVDSILSTMGLFHQDFAAAAGISHIAKQTFGASKNAAKAVSESK